MTYQEQANNEQQHVILESALSAGRISLCDF